MSDQIDNERTKLLANALDRASTACLTVGIISPIAGFVDGIDSTLARHWSGDVRWLRCLLGLFLPSPYIFGRAACLEV